MVAQAPAPATHITVTINPVFNQCCALNPFCQSSFWVCSTSYGHLHTLQDKASLLEPMEELCQKKIK